MNPSLWMNIPDRTKQPMVAKIRENPSYVSSKWQPIAFELPFPPEAIERASDQQASGHYMLSTRSVLSVAGTHWLWI
jgi:hypothetical protein